MRRFFFLLLLTLPAGRIPGNEFNEKLWKGIKGMDAKMPPISRAAFV